MNEEKSPLLQRSSSNADMSLPPPSPHSRPYRSRYRPVHLASIFLASMIILRLGLIGLYFPFDGPADKFKGDEYLASAHRILSNHPLIDGHDDLLIALRLTYGNKINQGNFSELWENGGLPGQLDIPRLKTGQMGGAFWSAWVPCPENISDFSDAAYGPLVRATLDQLDLYHRLSDLYPEYFTPSLNAAEAHHNFHSGKLISPLAIEGLHQIGNSASILRLYHRLGVRYATLTWNCHNRFADAAITGTSASTPLWHGISPIGRSLIYEMNRLGMLVDLSHVSANTMRDVLHGHHNLSHPATWQGSLAPPIFSHSSAYAICPHPRNVPDDVLRLVRERGSVVMVDVVPDFISCRATDDPSGIPEYVPENATLAQVIRHVRYIGELIGYDHVGIGTDFDGIAEGPEGFEGVDKYPDLVAELLRQGVSEKDMVKVIGGNLLRVWAEADKVSRRMKKEGWLPMEDEVAKLEP